MQECIFDKEAFLALKAAKENNHRLTIAQFARKICRNPTTVSKAIKKSEFREDLFSLFPMMHTKAIEARRREVEMQKVDARDVGALNVDTSLLHVRAAVMDWRKVA